jgi:membrane peptidoglycan carboxypeptidase
MRGVITYGTAKNCGLAGLSVGGKTGTSQKVDSATNAYSRQKVWASFIGFTPVENPVLLCGVMIDEPAGEQYGGTVAGPAFKQMLLQIINHPDLHYAEQLLGNEPLETLRNKTGKSSARMKSGNLPSLCGFDRNKAAGLLTSEKISFEIIGAGHTVLYQSPESGTVMAPETKLILYTAQKQTDDPDNSGLNGQVCVPNCQGKDLRDAINILNLKGLVPYIQGAGVVKKQDPVSGTMIRSMSRCTLFCSFDG